MKSVVVDTNVVVSALIAKGKPRQIVDMILRLKLNAWYSVETFGEFQTVLSRERFKKYEGFEDEASAFLSAIQSIGTSVSPQRHFHVCTDPDDDIFLDVAVQGKVEFLITGNTRHFPPHSFQGIRIVSPSEFLSLIR